MTAENPNSEPKKPTADQVPASVDEVGTRISAVCDMIGTRTYAAEVAGISTDQLARYILGRSQPAFPPIAKLAAKAGVRMEWIWTGEEPMKKAEVPPAAIVQSLSGAARLQLFDVAMSLGDGALNEEEKVCGYVDIPEAYLRDHLNIQPAHAAGVFVRGDSMEPTLLDGDIAILDTSVIDILRDDVYAFRVDEEGYVKRLQRQSGGKIIVKSDNPVYDPWELPKDGRVRIVGRVAGSIRRT